MNSPTPLLKTSLCASILSLGSSCCRILDFHALLSNSISGDVWLRPISKGYDSVFVVVDRLTKMSHLVPCTKTTTAPEFANMFLDYIIRLHGIPDSIVSDHGSIFTSQFWTALSKSLNLAKRLSTAFHPQTDGQTEGTNQTVEQYLRIYCNYHQDNLDNWSELLSLAEFSYNNTQHASIGCSPFYA